MTASMATRPPIIALVLILVFTGGVWAGGRISRHQPIKPSQEILFQISIPMRGGLSISKMKSYQNKKVRLIRSENAGPCLPPVPPLTLSLTQNMIAVEGPWPAADAVIMGLIPGDLEKFDVIAASDASAIPACAQSARITYGD